jgi:hypothetical protein
MTAAVLEAAEPRDENPFATPGFWRGVHKLPDHLSFAGEGGAELIPISPPTLEKEKLPSDEEFNGGKSGAGRGEDRLMGVIHGKRFPYLIANCK